MGRRSRKRGGGIAPAPAPASPPTARRAPSRRDTRPRAPWHPFPLVELCVLIGLVLLVWGLFRHDDDGGRVLLVCGMVLASLAGLETALREHFTGFRSHATLLSGLPAVLAAGVLFFARAPWISVPLAAALAFGVAFAALRRAFRRRG
jgi:putative exporter of polyketide antibiotics